MLVWGKNKKMSATTADLIPLSLTINFPEEQTLSLTVHPNATIQDISKGLRVMFNKFKENDKTLALAGFLIDALDEFDENNK